MNRQKRHKQARRQSGYQVHSFQQVNGVAPDVARALSLAVEHHQAGRLNEAERIYRNLLRTHPRLPDALHLLGLLAYQSGKHDEALHSVGKALAINQQAPYYNTQGVALRARGELQEAATSFRRALAMNPELAEAHHNLGIVLGDLGNREEALTSLERAVALKHDYVDALSSLGLTLTALGRFEEALVSLRRLVALTPDSAEAHANVGLALMHQGKHAEAADSLNRALALKPDSGEMLCNLGLVLRSQGKSNEAVEVLLRAVELRPDLPEVHHNLGVALCEAGEQTTGEDHLRRALALRPDYTEAHNNLGLALRAQGRPDDAEQSLLRAVALKPDYAEAHNNLGCVLRDRGQHTAAEESFERAVAVNPDLAEAYNNLGSALADRGEHNAAEEHLRRATALKPDYADAHANLGVVLKKKRKLAEAAESLRRAVALQPMSAEAYNNLGSVLGEQGSREEALEALRHALALKPDYAEAHSNLGVVLREQDRLEEALASFQRAVALRPEYTEGHYNLAVMLGDFDNQDEAIVGFERATELKPDYADAHFGVALARLLQGDLERGFAEYEWRWRCPAFAGSRPTFSQPEWDGSPLAGRTLLVYAEQGLGDTLQFARYLPLVAADGGRVVLEAQRELVPLLRSLTGGVHVVTRGEALPPFDVHAPLLSLPRLLCTTLDTIPAAVPYLQPDAERVAAWNDELAQSGAGRNGLRVGLVWAGNPDHKGDRRRSLPLAALAPLRQVPGIQLLGLQKGPAAVQAEAPPAGLEMTNLGPLLADFSDTAAVVEQLDLVITVDTAVAHLAGALGRPTWVLLPFAPDWRWLRERADCPWYPTARLFRQPKFGDWTDVVSEVASVLHEFAASAPVDRNTQRTAVELRSPAQPAANGRAPVSATYVAMPLGGGHGWGVCGRYLTKELSLLGPIRLATNQLDADTVGDELEYQSLKRIAYRGISAPADAPVLQCIQGQDMLPYRPALRGRFTAGYTFFEENILPPTSIDNARRYFDVVVAGSTWCQQVLEEHGLTDVQTIIQGIDPDVFFPAQTEKEYFRDQFVVFSGGKLELRKGQDLVIRAYKVLQDRHPDVLLVNSWYNQWDFSLNTMRASRFIKFAPTATDYLEKINQVLADNDVDVTRVITLLPRVNSTMRRVYCNTDVGLFPNRCEGGTNLVLMEYMACGRPAIASYNSGHKDVVTGENAALIRTMSPIILERDGRHLGTWEEPDLDETIEQLEWAYQNREQLRELGRRAGRDLAELTWKRTAQQFHEILSTGVRRSGASGSVAPAAPQPRPPGVFIVQAQDPMALAAHPSGSTNGHQAHAGPADGDKPLVHDMAEMHELIVSHYFVGDDLPGADMSLVARIERSPEYAIIRDRVADARPADSWEQDGLHLYVFQLRPLEGAADAEPPTAVFTMHPELTEPLSAVVVTPGRDGQEAGVTDLRNSAEAYTAPLVGVISHIAQNHPPADAASESPFIDASERPPRSKELP
jgi:Tfp pilus assembly protein PilF/glycosyltransferase involved in cell wall biosynthesis